eukprot:4543059-Amphidinium_carterae.1
MAWPYSAKAFSSLPEAQLVGWACMRVWPATSREEMARHVHGILVKCVEPIRWDPLRATGGTGGGSRDRYGKGFREFVKGEVPTWT